MATVRWTTDQILRTLMPDEVPVEYTVDNGEVVVTAISIPSEIVGKKAIDVDLEGRRKVVAVSRFGVPRVPEKDLALQDGDILHVSVVRGDLPTLTEDLKKVGAPE